MPCVDCVPNLPEAPASAAAEAAPYVSTLPKRLTYTLDPLFNRLGRVRRQR